MHTQHSHQILSNQPLRFANYLSPLLQETYQAISEALGDAIHHAVTLDIGQSPTEFQHGQVDAGFICGLLYTHTTLWPGSPLEVLAAPVLYDSYFENNEPSLPRYFSAVIVPRNSRYTSFDDLAGCTWAFNEPGSHSGYNLVYYSLLERGKSLPYFGTTIQSGSHLNSIQMVLDGRADAAAIDSQIFTVLCQQNVDVARELRVVDMLGPSSSPPVAVARALPADLKHTLRATLLTLHEQPHMRPALERGAIQRFVGVTDTDYDDIRAMFKRVQSANIATKAAGERTTDSV